MLHFNASIELTLVRIELLMVTVVPWSSKLVEGDDSLSTILGMAVRGYGGCIGVLLMSSGSYELGGRNQGVPPCAIVSLLLLS